jgi:hypothetical protein
MWLQDMELQWSIITDDTILRLLIYLFIFVEQKYKNIPAGLDLDIIQNIYILYNICNSLHIFSFDVKD